MGPDEAELRRRLREAGLSDQLVKAAWPKWWTDEAAESPSARTELRFALARKLGLSPKRLVGERVEFIWNDEARFKHLSAEDAAQRAALTSFGMTIGRMLLHASPKPVPIGDLDADQLRKAILERNRYVELSSLLGFCWAVGIPVIHLRVFPLAAKSMHAMVIELDGRHAILLGRDASYPAPVAFTLSHEIGHIVLRHLEGAPALVDLKDPAEADDLDEQEIEADRFALTLLTGRPEPDIRPEYDNFNAQMLAKSVAEAGPLHGIEPGTLALCLAYRRGIWARAMATLKILYGEPRPVWREINGIADRQLDWHQLTDESADYLATVMAGTGG